MSVEEPSSQELLNGCAFPGCDAECPYHIAVTHANLLKTCSAPSCRSHIALVAARLADDLRVWALRMIEEGQFADEVHLGRGRHSSLAAELARENHR